MAVTTIFKRFTFEAAHHLPAFPEGHKCRRLHGHRYEAVVYVTGPIEQERQIVLDYADLGVCLDAIHQQLDHQNLNDLFQNPTAEVIAHHIFQSTDDWLATYHSHCRVTTVTLNETCTAGVVVEI
jgi:6-pyruvoyltetrahydropterin/6-carboxytetrahydropterin synthase